MIKLKQLLSEIQVKNPHKITVKEPKNTPNLMGSEVYYYDLIDFPNIQASNIEDDKPITDETLNIHILVDSEDKLKFEKYLKNKHIKYKVETDDEEMILYNIPRTYINVHS